MSSRHFCFSLYKNEDVSGPLKRLSCPWIVTLMMPSFASPLHPTSCRPCATGRFFTWHVYHEGGISMKLWLITRSRLPPKDWSGWGNGEVLVKLRVSTRKKQNDMLGNRERIHTLECRQWGVRRHCWPCLSCLYLGLHVPYIWHISLTSV